MSFDKPESLRDSLPFFSSVRGGFCFRKMRHLSATQTGFMGQKPVEYASNIMLSIYLISIVSYGQVLSSGSGEQLHLEKDGHWSREFRCNIALILSKMESGVEALHVVSTPKIKSRSQR